MCGDGYCAPAVEGVHVTGATHAFEDESTEVREIDHTENLANLAEYAPNLHQALSNDSDALCEISSGHKEPFVVHPQGVGRGCKGRSPQQHTHSLSNHERPFDIAFSPEQSRRGRANGLAGLSGRASVRCSAPGAMPLVGEVQEGLYCSLAHGTRGLLTAGLAGEVLAAQICGQLAPLPATILTALAPLPRVRNKGKCAA